MAGKRSRAHIDDPKRPPPQPKLAALNPNWAQLKAKMSSHPRRHKATQNNAQFQTSEKESENPVIITHGMSSTLSSLQPLNDDCSVTDTLAMDCEMVGVGTDGRKNALARVTLVNMWGNAVYDEYVRPMEFVTDFRSNISGVRPCDLRKAEDLFTVQKKVCELIKGRILVGHALHNDLKVLFLTHPKKDVRDTSVYKPLRSNKGWPRGLRDLAAQILGAKIQENEHNSLPDGFPTPCNHLMGSPQPSYRLKMLEQLCSYIRSSERNGKKALD